MVQQTVLVTDPLDDSVHPTELYVPTQCVPQYVYLFLSSAAQARCSLGVSKQLGRSSIHCSPNRLSDGSMGIREIEGELIEPTGLARTEAEM